MSTQEIQSKMVQWFAMRATRAGYFTTEADAIEAVRAHSPYRPMFNDWKGSFYEIGTARRLNILATRVALILQGHGDFVPERSLAYYRRLFTEYPRLVA